jgi:hypothetical protein
MGIHFTVGTSYERAVSLAEKIATTGLSDFSVHGAARRHFSRQVAQNFRRRYEATYISSIKLKEYLPFK